MWMPMTLALFFLVISSLHAEEVKPKDRYFFSGNGSIHLINANTGKAAQVQYRLPDGSYPAETVDKLMDYSVFLPVPAIISRCVSCCTRLYRRSLSSAH